jgi:hypothetical protein
VSSPKGDTLLNSNLFKKLEKYFDQIKIGSYVAVLLGSLLGIFNVVRTGALLIALGTSLLVTIAFLRSNRHRKIELILPLGVAVLLFVVALTLPHAK